jgi:uncharacterized membrane protein YidH (DUF202 family)
MSKDEIIELLEELVAMVEGPAVEIYTIALQANLRSSLFLLGLGLFFVIVAVKAYFLGIVSFSRAFKKWRAEEPIPHSRYGPGWTDEQVTANVVLVVAVIFASVLIPVSVFDLLTLEWRTLQQLVPGI